MQLVPFVATTLVVALVWPLLAARQDGACMFPSRWHGTWFQSGVRQPISIEQSRLSSKGRCLRSDGDKFVVVDEKGCFRCVVIHEKHHNVLQYKETFCHTQEALSSLCSLITGDALLYSMFRVDATAEACPFRGPFTFTYNRGYGECRTPVSSIDSCTDDSRLLLRYQACPDISGTESTVEELQCLATWKEGSSRYLVGKVHHSHASSNEERYRCFVYEKTSAAGTPGADLGADAGHHDEGVDYRVAQSGDATCNGLFTPLEGSRTMTLTRASSPAKCRFPSWLTGSHHWHTLDYRRAYSLKHRNTTLRIANVSTAGFPAPSSGPSLSMELSQPGHEMRVVCSELRAVTHDTAQIVAHFTTGCQSGYMCMQFYRRDPHVIELQTGGHSRRPEDACSVSHFNKSSLPYVTLVTAFPEQRACPYQGEFTVTGVNRLRTQRDLPDSPCDGDDTDFTSLVVGCSAGHTMEFRSDCADEDFVSTYSCHGHWEDNGTNFLITTPLSRTSHGARRLCFMYREVDGVVHFSSSADSCTRAVSPGIGGSLAFNVTSTGRCLETSSAPSTVVISLSLPTLLATGVFGIFAVYQYSDER
ncbi:uncharacterized protein LOC126249589 [Schistocerca nitens]|uniref:uncharacterized protein LOC126249589 n=1 Tax=Schistocerca nitens TaxID=7011 RepID=UPI0021188C97|nr:uncharacterized protein LOC126249589 [Schistocerca nitens]